MTGTFNGNLINFGLFDTLDDSSESIPEKVQPKTRRPRTSTMKTYTNYQGNKLLELKVTKANSGEGPQEGQHEYTKPLSLPDEWKPSLPVFPDILETKNGTSQLGTIAGTFLASGIALSRSGIYRVSMLEDCEAEGLLYMDKETEGQEIDRIQHSGKNILTHNNLHQINYKVVLRCHFEKQYAARATQLKTLTGTAYKEYIRHSIMHRDIADHDPYNITFNLEDEINTSVERIINAVLEAYGVGEYPELPDVEGGIRLVRSSASGKTGNTGLGGNERNWYLRIDGKPFHPEQVCFSLKGLQLETIIPGYKTRYPAERREIVTDHYKRLVEERIAAGSRNMTVAEYRKVKRLEDIALMRSQGTLPWEAGDGSRGAVRVGATRGGISQYGQQGGERVKNVEQLLERIFSFQNFKYKQKTYSLNGVFKDAYESVTIFEQDHFLTLDLKYNNLTTLRWSEIPTDRRLRQREALQGEQGRGRPKRSAGTLGKWEITLNDYPTGNGSSYDDAEKEKLRRILNRILQRAGKRYFQLKLIEQNSAVEGNIEAGAKRWALRIAYHSSRPEAQHNGTYPLDDGELGKPIDVDFITKNLEQS